MRDAKYVQYYTEIKDGNVVPSDDADAVVELDDGDSAASHHALAQSECTSRGFVGYTLMKRVAGGTVQTSSLKLLQEWI